MAVMDWIDGFLKRHRARYRPGDWPDPGGDEWGEYAELWRLSLVRAGATEAEADAASKLCGERPPNYRREHLPMVLGAIKLAREARQTAPGEVGTREEAVAKSKGCEHCGGNGLASVWNRAPDPARRIAPTAAAYCVCRLGRHIKRNHAFSRECRDLIGRIPDLADVLEGRSDWLAEAPGLEVTI